jgi:hypothetical protein
VFTKVSNEWIDKHGMTWANYDISAMNYFKTFEGREVIKLSADESAKWVQATSPLVAKYIKERADKGLPAEQYQKFLIEKAKAWAQKSPSDQAIIDYDKAEFPK